MALTTVFTQTQQPSTILEIADSFSINTLQFTILSVQEMLDYRNCDDFKEELCDYLTETAPHYNPNSDYAIHFPENKDILYQHHVNTFVLFNRKHLSIRNQPLAIIALPSHLAELLNTSHLYPCFPTYKNISEYKAAMHEKYEAIS